MNISVLQWNIWYKEDVRKIVEFLKENPADIICLQELPINYATSVVKDSPEYIARELGYNFFYKDLPIEDTDGLHRTLANGIFSKFPIKSSRFAWTKESTGKLGYDDESRAYVEVVLDINGNDITVGTTHMSYTHDFAPNESKKKETDMLLKELKQKSEAYIFAADLNALPGSYTIDSISNLMQNASPSLDQKTWTTKPFSYNGFEANSLGWRLDYIFTTKDIKLIESKILHTEYSDHLPVFAYLEVN
ncbi:MAG: endonuclease/exonuclease/phosphatase [Candidatus Saccharibacteria bacterium]|nr:endonuclease/exonuclease/phosphatase [Candidatus Saccharibacteria bacterium]